VIVLAGLSACGSRCGAGGVCDEGPCPPGEDHLGTEGTCFPVTSTTTVPDVPLSLFPPVVVASDPPAGATGVDPAITRLRVTFSQRMDPDTWRWAEVDDAFPPTRGVGFEDAWTAFVDVALPGDGGWHVWVNEPTHDDRAFRALTGRAALPWSFVFATGPDPAWPDDAPPVVVASVPIAGKRAVDAALGALRFTFDRPMDPDTVGLSTDPRSADPALGAPAWDGPDTLVVPVSLESGTTYAVWVNADGDGLRDPSGQPAVTWLLAFSTF
jgi:hypothetical protein